jgi:hypothetical protein
MSQNGQPPKVLASINIQLMSDGSVPCMAKVPNRKTFNLMMATAQQDMVAAFMEKEKAEAEGPQIEVAPAGFVLP